MDDGVYKAVFGATKEIEALLEDKLGADGRGLHAKALSVQKQLGARLLKKIQFLATVRNKLAHEDAFDDVPMEAFLQTKRQVLEALEALPGADRRMAQRAGAAGRVRSSEKKALDLDALLSEDQRAHRRRGWHASSPSVAPRRFGFSPWRAVKVLVSLAAGVVLMYVLSRSGDTEPAPRTRLAPLAQFPLEPPETPSLAAPVEPAPASSPEPPAPASPPKSPARGGDKANELRARPARKEPEPIKSTNVESVRLTPPARKPESNRPSPESPPASSGATTKDGDRAPAIHLEQLRAFERKF